MHRYPNSGWIDVICGPMYSGKTEELRRRIRRALFAGKQVALFTSVRDEHHEDFLSVSLRSGVSVSAVPVAKSSDLLAHIDDDTEVVAIDEVHFFDGALPAVAADLAGRGLHVICAGLDTDFVGRTFGPIGNLLAQAESVLKLHAICAQCSGTASRTQRLENGRAVGTDQPTIRTTEDARYEARCRACHMVPESDD